MKPTEQDIEQAARKYCKERGYKPSGYARIAHEAGAKWAISLQPEWVSVTERLPEIGHVVLVKTSYMDRGRPATDCFTGYMDEYGDLIVHPTDENYGWEFNECVTQWSELPQPKTK